MIHFTDNIRVALPKINRELDRIAGRMTENKISWDLRAWIRELERRKHSLLAIEEATWRLKSRAIWLKEGDKNTKFFHRYANKRRDTIIWEFKNEEGNMLHSQEDITKEVVKYFKIHTEGIGTSGWKISSGVSSLFHPRSTRNKMIIYLLVSERRSYCRS